MKASEEGAFIMFGAAYNSNTPWQSPLSFWKRMQTEERGETGSGPTERAIANGLIARIQGKPYG